MTVGQRIAQKRKEFGLSQETLGEQLGVSRQAIYKWESDTTLPEIEKLIALSRIFSVSVGWLLGEEEDSAPKELSEEQLHMVQEIVDRYLSARAEQESSPAAPWWPVPDGPDLSPEQLRLVSAVASRVQETLPPPTPVKRRRWPWVIAAAACLAIIIALFSLSEQLRSLDNQTHYLQSSMQSIQNGVAHQISSITGRVEEILKSQNDLTADYSTEVITIDPAAGMATFNWRVLPKTYQPGMQAWIDIENGPGVRITYGPYDPVREVFSGEFTVALTDNTKIYIIFESDGIRQTQLLDTYKGLLSGSYPSCWLDSHPLILDVDDKTDALTDDLYANLIQTDDSLFSEPLKGYRVGLFADQELVAWFTPTTRDVILNGVQTQEGIHFLSKEGMVLDHGKTYCVAAVVTDAYGREFVISDSPIHWTVSGWSPVGSYSSGPHFEGWTY